MTRCFLKFLFIGFLTLLLVPIFDFAESKKSETLFAVAKTAQGQVAYTEVHRIDLNANGAPLAARTSYYSPDKSLRATLETDFKAGLAASDYTFEDRRDGSSHGVEVQKNGYLVWKKSKDGKRQEKFFKTKDFGAHDLVVSGQGLFFYLRSHLADFKKGDSRPIKLLIPGRLDYFSFDLAAVEETGQFVSFKMRVNSVFLRLFVPSLRFKFDKSTNEIVEYFGPSNLVDPSGDLQNVQISYQANDPQRSMASKKDF